MHFNFIYQVSDAQTTRKIANRKIHYYIILILGILP